MKNTEKAVKRFNFTYAINGGAWLEYANGEITWEPFDRIEREQGEGWFERMRSKQGMFTGCWVNCDV